MKDRTRKVSHPWAKYFVIPKRTAEIELYKSELCTERRKLRVNSSKRSIKE
jgi:hypothetical protein